MSETGGKTAMMQDTQTGGTMKKLWMGVTVLAVLAGGWFPFENSILANEQVETAPTKTAKTASGEDGWTVLNWKQPGGEDSIKITVRHAKAIYAARCAGHKYLCYTAEDFVGRTLPECEHSKEIGGGLKNAPCAMRILDTFLIHPSPDINIQASYQIEEINAKKFK